MNKEAIEIFIKSLLDQATNIQKYNDRAPTNSKYPYLIIDSSSVSINEYPRIDISLELNVWDRSQNYSSVNRVADEIQLFFDRKSFVNDQYVFTFYIDSRDNLDDEDKTLKRCLIKYDLEIYSKEES